MTDRAVATAAVGLHILAVTQRERTRTLLRRTFPRRRGKVTVVRASGECADAMASDLVDAVIVDTSPLSEDFWHAAALAREFPSVPFFALAPLRMADGPTIARCISYEFTDVIAEGTDDAALAELVTPKSFTVRFADALRDAHGALGLESQLQRRAWQAIVAHGGRTVRTEAIAEQLGVTREHLSRSFSVAEVPNLKRVIDLVRVIAAAELAKNAGYDLSDVSRVLVFASPSHLTGTAQRIVGTRSASLARLRTTDLIERFRAGRGRSRSTD